MHRPLGQDLQQRGREALRPAAEEAAGAAAQGPRGGVLLRGHDGAWPADGHEAAGRGRGVPPDWQVGFTLICLIVCLVRSFTCLFVWFGLEDLCSACGVQWDII